MNIILLCFFISFISLTIIIISLLSNKKYKDNCEDDHQIVNYNHIILFGALLIIILVAILFFTNRNIVSKFSFGWGSSKSM